MLVFNHSRTVFLLSWWRCSTWPWTMCHFLSSSLGLSKKNLTCWTNTTVLTWQYPIWPLECWEHWQPPRGLDSHATSRDVRSSWHWTITRPLSSRHLPYWGLRTLPASEGTILDMLISCSGSHFIAVLFSHSPGSGTTACLPKYIPTSST